MRGLSPLAFERNTRADLRARRWLRWHVFLIGLVTFGACWALSHALMAAGVESMALRHAVALAGAYALYLATLWAWARWLLSRDEGDVSIDVPDLGGLGDGGGEPVRSFEAGGGGDFAGGGAGGSWTDGAGDAVSGMADVAGGLDEGIVVVVPLALVIGAAVAIGSALGFAVFGLFGIEVLLGVAVEIAFASVGGALAFKARREGWLGFAFRRTVWPMVLTMAATVVLGLAAAAWLPQARTLPQALRLLFG